MAAERLLCQLTDPMKARCLLSSRKVSSARTRTVADTFLRADVTGT
ncbi:hypothetical protein GCM10018965_052930 [Nonomuraea roseola]